MRVAGRDLAVWRAPDGAPHAGPDECPHLGASLCGGRVDGRGRALCPWHGLALGGKAHGAWAPVEVHDDGVLTWVRLPELLAKGERFTDAPILCERPKRFLSGVIRVEARCEPRDVIANRLDPWHGVHFHPYAFLRLRTISEDDSQITVRVVYRVLGPLGMEVDARFTCSDARTIVMTIVAGDGVGSVVETHATPIGRGQSAVIEATLATSDRLFFPMFLRAQRLIRPFIEARAAMLWADDKVYAERLAELRAKRPQAPPIDQRSDAMKPRGGIE
jgi:isorenieratene synthase